MARRNKIQKNRLVLAVQQRRKRKITDFNTEDSKGRGERREKINPRGARMGFLCGPLCSQCYWFFIFVFVEAARSRNRYSTNPRLTSSLSTMASDTSFIDFRRWRLWRWMVR